MAKMIKKTYYYDSKGAKKVEKLAKKLKVTESQIARWENELFDYDLMLEALKNKRDEYQKNIL